MVDIDNKAKINIEVAYALPNYQFLQSVRVPAGTTAREALDLSELAIRFPALDLTNEPIGIFGKRVKAATVLKEGDRVEVYRPLQKDPREARRERAAKS